MEVPTAKEVICKVIQKGWLTPTVVGLRFEPSKKFNYEAGQFLSVVIPNPDSKSKVTKRAYSFSSPDAKYGYELCVKHVLGGIGSGFIASLNEGDTFRAFAPYGDFRYVSSPARSVCFISTGTGLAPFRGITLSKEFRENPPRKTLLLFGARGEREIIYPGVFEKMGIEVVNALSKPTPFWGGFRGHVTDYLRSLPPTWNWHGTDFYICGNGSMAQEAVEILQHSHGVDPKSIHSEVYFTPTYAAEKKAA